MGTGEKTIGQGRTLRAKLWWLIVGRMTSAALLFVLSSTLFSREQAAVSDRSGRLIFIVVTILTALYAITLRLNSRWRLQASIQLSIDVLIVTWLVWATGDVRSPFAALYIVIISVASIFLGARAALVASVSCAAIFTGLSVAILSGRIPSFTPLEPEVSTLKLIQSVGLNDIAFLVVGLLAAQLAQRQSRYDVQLSETTQTLADLRALHERIVESIRSGVITTDLQGSIYTFNAAAAEITGYEAEDVRGQEVSIFFGELGEHVEESMRAAEAGEPSPRFEANCLTAEGLRLRLGFSIFPLFAESGETTGLVITFQDLTQVRSLEETSRRQDRLAAVGRVAASIAHEIRNPLAAMRGSIQVLRSEMDTNSSQAELMEIILRESDRLNRIITDYLTYARPRSQAPHSVDVRELLRETFTLLRHSPEIKDGHGLEEDYPDEAMLVNADSSQLKQVFWNIARNALQAMPEGGTLRAELRRSVSNRVRITFTDSGIGMSPEQVEHLFEPFSSRTGGTGLGLSIVYQIIRDHGGTINVRSREGRGTTIAIEIPGEKQNPGARSQNPE
ncbi:MAG: two-component system, NtrC family, sensor histidine kinase PilS [Acidobacteriota bacterium]|jgi:two-component system sensor histidine kinase PilS (NtrC family)|nr:two-component system, NtrC family, sensor histidine kinase PilS [Acidobacteriota bacterium]